jgi:uncharacterized membrane protein YfcA
VLGGMAVAAAPVELLKIVLGAVLIVAAVKIVSHKVLRAADAEHHPR